MDPHKDLAGGRTWSGYLFELENFQATKFRDNYRLHFASSAIFSMTFFISLLPVSGKSKKKFFGVDEKNDRLLMNRSIS